MMSPKESFKRVYRSAVKRWLHDNDGSFAAMGVFAAFLILVGSGLAIDYLRLTDAKQELIYVLDSSVLSASHDTTLPADDLEDIFENTLNTLLADRPNLKNTNYTFEVNAPLFGESVLKASAVADVNLVFASIFGATRQVGTVTEVTSDRRRIEVAMVLDISSSMNDAKLNEMKAAASDFITVLSSNPSVSKRIHFSLVPFGGTVKLPPEFKTFLIEPPVQDKVYWQNGVWNGCVFMRPEHYENGIDQTLQYEYMPSYYSYTHTEQNPFCPRDGSELRGLTQNVTSLLDQIKDFGRSDGTATGVGMAWGVATLDPLWRNVFPNVNKFRPAKYSKNTRKIILLMSDGGTSPLIYPRAEDFDTTLPFIAPAADSEILSSVDMAIAHQKVCALAKSKGMEIYSVGFQISNQTHTDSLQNCATSTTHFFASNPGDLGAVFQNIAGAITGSRISQ